MAKSKSSKSSKKKATQTTASWSADALEMHDPEARGKAMSESVHTYKAGKGGPKVICDTDSVGFPTPQGRSPFEIVVDASEGFIPLWAVNSTLRWRFQERSLNVFVDPEKAKKAIRGLFAEALLLWGDACPVRFAERNDVWDFEIVVRASERCNVNGCVLASAFFPDPGRHELVLYPTLFKQSHTEQIETMCHELGHVFGLRHFFAKVSETAWPSEIFGEHSRFSIMNYGADSIITDADRDDLTALYLGAWSGEFSAINETPIQLVRPYSYFRDSCLSDADGHAFAFA